MKDEIKLFSELKATSPCLTLVTRFGWKSCLFGWNFL